MPLIAASISFDFVRLLDIVVSDFVEHVAEQIELPIGIGRRSVSGRTDEQQRLRRRDGRRGSQNDANSQVTSFTNSSARLFDV